VYEFYLMCDDVERFIEEMKEHGIACAPVRDEGWGMLTQLALPGGGKLGVYQPRHARPKAMSARKKAKKPARSATKKRGKTTKKTSKKKA
jgi:hypothetical protein